MKMRKESKKKLCMKSKKVHDAEFLKLNLLQFFSRQNTLRIRNTMKWFRTHTHTRAYHVHRPMKQ